MSKNKEIEKEYVEKLSEYAEKKDFSTYFDSMATLSEKEHKMLLEGYKNAKISKAFIEFEFADLYDLNFMERNNGGNN